MTYIWNLQSNIGHGYTILGVISALDKAPLTIGTGYKEMHPALLLLVNIISGVQMKVTVYSFSLTSYIPTPKWLDVSSDITAVLIDCPYHVCIDIITKNLKRAEASGTKPSDPMGNLRLCHTPLILCICDLPEQCIQACILNNQSPVTLATLEQFVNKHLILIALAPISSLTWHRPVGRWTPHFDSTVYQNL